MYCTYGSLCHTEQEAASQHTTEVLSQEGQEADNGPSHAEAAQVPRWAHSVENHIRRNLPRDVTHEQDGDQCVVLCASKAEVLLQGVKFGVDKGVAVQEVEEVHDPKHRLLMEIRDCILVVAFRHLQG